MEFRADTAIDYVIKGSTIVHVHLILVLKALHLGARHTFCHHLVTHIHRVVHPWDELRCIAHGERVYLREQADELDDQISLSLVLEVAHFSSV